MTASTGFIGCMYEGELRKNIETTVQNISSKFNWNASNNPHTTFVYLGKEYMNFTSDDTKTIPTNIKCKLSGFDFIGKSLVCKVSVLDNDKLSNIEQLNTNDYPPVPFYHITLGKFNNWKDVNAFKKFSSVESNSSLINNIDFTLDSLNLISVSQPNKQYTIIS